MRRQHFGLNTAGIALDKNRNVGEGGKLAFWQSLLLINLARVTAIPGHMATILMAYSTFSATSAQPTNREPIID